MLNKLIIVFISLVLTSCFFEKTKKPVVIIDRSTGQENIDYATKKNRVPLASNDISINGKSAILAIPAPRVNIL
jgi:hypothetical protein